MKTKLLPLILLALVLTGCPALVAHDPANQKRIDYRERLDVADRLYASTEREITAAFTAGVISPALDATLISELQNVVHPLLKSAKAALIDGDFDAAILKAETALNALAEKTPKATNPSISPGLR